MKIYHGIAVSPGIAMAKTLIMQTEDFVVPRTVIVADDIPRQIAKFEDALTLTRKDIMELRKKISSEMGHEHSEIFNAHLLILEDRTLIEDVIAMIKNDKVSAEYSFANIF